MAINSYIGAQINPANNTFQTWLSRTNDIIEDMGSTVITVGDNNTGDVFIDGAFSANVIYIGNELRGGDANLASDFTISSNVEFTGANTTINSGEIQLTGNVDINSASSEFNVNTIKTTINSANTIITGLSQLNDVDISGDLSVSGNATFTSEVIFSSNVQSFNVPVGNTATRPDPAEAGMFRFNTELENFEGYDGVFWGPIGSGSEGAIDVVDTDANTIHYITFSEFTNGVLSSLYVSDNDLIFNPSTGTLETTSLVTQNISANTSNITTVTSEDITANTSNITTVTSENITANTSNITTVTSEDITANTVTANDFNSLSDISYKKNVTSINNSVELIEKINPVMFNWKENDMKSYGVIAQELEKIMPELVSQKEKTKYVNYIPLIALLLNGYKELLEKIEKLEQKS